MCKYCEPEEKYELQPLWLKRDGCLFKDEEDMKKNKDKKKFAVIVNLKSNCSVENKGFCLSIKGENETDPFDWLDLKINFCPICGKQLRKELVKF